MGCVQILYYGAACSYNNTVFNPAKADFYKFWRLFINQASLCFESFNIHYSSSWLKAGTYPFLLHFVKCNLCWCPFVQIRLFGFCLLVVLTVCDLLQAFFALFILLLLSGNKTILKKCQLISVLKKIWR